MRRRASYEARPLSEALIAASAPAFLGDLVWQAHAETARRLPSTELIRVFTVAQLEAALRAAAPPIGPRRIVLAPERYELVAPLLIDERSSGNRAQPLGFRPERLRLLEAKPELPTPITEPRRGQREAPRDFVGMSIKSIETLEEQSAAGLPSEEGVMILAIPPGSATDRAGLKVGDVITAIDGSKEVPGPKASTAAALVVAAQGRKWQGQMGIVVMRNQNSQVLTRALQ